MAKKSNKTSRVLNLLSNDPKEEVVEKKTEKEEKPIQQKTNSQVLVVDENEERSDVILEIEKALSREITIDIKTIQQKKEELKRKMQMAINEKRQQEIEDVKIAKSITDDKIKLEQEGYSFVNVMEYIIKLRIDEYLEEFSVCDCSRCRADVTALTLTNLPSKYVVVDKNNVSPRLYYYENIYLGKVAVELTKACMSVAKTPHHR